MCEKGSGRGSREGRDVLQYHFLGYWPTRSFDVFAMWNDFINNVEDKLLQVIIDD